jgi:hypothetical protein
MFGIWPSLRLLRRRMIALAQELLKGFVGETVFGKGIYGDSVHRIRRKTSWCRCSNKQVLNFAIRKVTVNILYLILIMMLACSRDMYLKARLS